MKEILAERQYYMMEATEKQVFPKSKPKTRCWSAVRERIDGLLEVGRGGWRAPLTCLV